jgi:hypothetical protein
MALQTARFDATDCTLRRYDMHALTLQKSFKSLIYQQFAIA